MVCLLSGSEGTIEPGSSGSGLFDADGNLRGVASGAPSDPCPIIAGYGRFDRFYDNNKLVRDYLGPDDGTPDDETPDDETPTMGPRTMGPRTMTTRIRRSEPLASNPLLSPQVLWSAREM